MEAKEKSVLVINAGSSSIKFALYTVEEPMQQFFRGQIERMNTPNTILSHSNPGTSELSSFCIDTLHINDTTSFFIDWLQQQPGFGSIQAIGHRIVHGMNHSQPEVITTELLDELKSIRPYDPDHLPEEIKLIELFKTRFPDIPQVACFDTSFHTTMPSVARLIAIPRRFTKKGMQRYGFHGLSYAYLLEELEKVAGKQVASGKIILAHLGSGASLCAVKDGKSMDTTMGFTPASGLPMGTRTGDIDPGVAWVLMQYEKMSPEEFNQIINYKSGMLGISETSADMRDLLSTQNEDTRATEAIEYFCYQTKKFISSYIAVLEGLDTLIFSGGIGEHAPEIRARICKGLGFLGIEIDESRNKNSEEIISTDTSRVCVRVIETNEQLMIARSVYKILNY